MRPAAVSGAQVSAGGFVSALNSGVVEAVTLGAGGTLTVYNQGSAHGADINQGGIETVLNGGEGQAITVHSAGFLLISAGGTVSGVTVDAGGVVMVPANANLTDVSGPGAVVSSGVVTYDPVAGAKDQGLAAQNLLISSSGEIFVWSGGTTTGTTIDGGIESVFTGGAVSSSYLAHGATEDVGFGGAASFTTLDQATIDVQFAQVVSATLSSGGLLRSYSATVSASTVGNGGSQVIGVGATDSASIVDSGGFESVSSGIAVDATLSGRLEVLYGGATSAATIDGGYEIVSNGGVASGSVINNGGSQVVLPGGIAVSTTINAGGFEVISGNGSSISATIGAGGEQWVLPFGTTTATTIDTGGIELVMPGGGVGETTVEAGGTLVLLPGADATLFTSQTGAFIISAGVVGVTTAGAVTVYANPATSLTVSAGEDLYVYSTGATASDTTIDAHGVEFVTQAGTALGDTVEAGGAVSVTGFAHDSGAVVSSGGYMLVSGGGVAVNATIAHGGFLAVSSGGTIEGTVLDDSQYFISFGGSAAQTTVEAGGIENILGGGVTISSLIQSGGYAVVSNYGTALDTTIDDGGLMLVLRGGTASLPTTIGGGAVISAGVVVVDRGLGFTYEGITVSNLSLDGNPQEFVLHGGTTTATTLKGGAREYVYSGGAASATTVSAGGFELVSGGIASGTRILAGGNALVEDNGVLSGGTIAAGGYAVISSYGVASGVTVEPGGVQWLGYGGSSFQTDIENGAVEYVTFAGSATSAVIDSGGRQVVSNHGYVSATVIQSGGVQYVLSGAEADSSTIMDGGIEIVSGGDAQETTVDVGGLLLLLGDADASDTVNNGGFVVSTGVVVVHTDPGFDVYVSAATGLVLGAGDIGYVISGGTTTGTTVDSGGVEFVISGVVSDTTVNNGGFEVLSYGGAAADTTIGSGGFQVVSWGASARDTTVEAGGNLIVLPHGSTTGAVNNGGTVISAGVVLIDPGAGGHVYGATGTGIVAGSGAQAIAWSGGITTGTHVGFGGVEEVLNGGFASGTVVGSGGGQYLYSGSAEGTDVKSGGAIYVYNQWTGATVSNLTLETGATLDLPGLNFDYNYSATYDAAAGTLTVNENGTTFTTNLEGNYAGDFFRAERDGTQGTMITVEGVPCYCRGTRILTDRGERPVEELAIGDRLVTVSGAARPLRWIGRRAYSGRFAAGNRDVLPVLFRAGSLGDDLPRRDLWVSPLHAMYLDGHLVPALALVNGASIIQAETVDQVEYFHLELESHDILLAEGAPAESFLDDDSRGMFHNAAEYRALYPDAVAEPARYCAPRLEEGAMLHALHRRLAALAAPPRPAPGELTGAIDQVGRSRITGWARDLGRPDIPARLRVAVNFTPVAEITADRFRADLLAAGIGDGCFSFDVEIPGGLSPLADHVVTVRRAEDGADLPSSPWQVKAAARAPAGAGAAPLLTPVSDAAPPNARGSLDRVTRTQITGWAQDAEHPEEPVPLVVIDNGLPIARVVANRHRADLQAAGIGSGRHSFDLAIPGGLSPLARHVVAVRREADGTELTGSPMVIEPAGRFDADLQQTVAGAVAALDSAADRQQALDFILAQADRLRQAEADAQSGRADRLAARRLARETGEAAMPGKRALVIDALLPDAGRDAGSVAVLSHIRALQRLGYTVSVAAAEEDAPDAAVMARLRAVQITVCAAPAYASVEEVLRRQRDCFDVVYLHRADIAARYLSLARRYQPRGKLLYSVADLHHLRLQRQAAVEDRPELLAESRRLRLVECTAAWSADAVITHSEAEARILRRAVPEARVHVVGWDVPVRPVETPFADRNGLAFIANYAHAPNADAARWLVDQVMPRVWRNNPAITCRLVGANMPDAVRRLVRPGVDILGAVDDLAAVFDQIRLTVAPLRFGAGIKGKVLESLAAGIPCPLTGIAAEGIPLSGDLATLIGSDAPALAAIIERLHADATANAAAGAAGLALIRDAFDQCVVDTSLAAALDLGPASLLAVAG